VRSIELLLKNGLNMTVATTISSDGKIRMYDISSAISKFEKEESVTELQPIGMHDTGGARLTCLDVVGGAGTALQGGEMEIDEEDDIDDDDDDDDDEGEEDATLDQAEVEELYNLLDLVEEAKRQGIDVEGMSDFEGGPSDDDDDDDEDVYDDSNSEDGNEEEEEEEEEEEGENEEE
jgi:hypothetical protein